MIDRKDLRIGNIVMHEDCVTTIEVIDIPFVHLSCFSSIDYDSLNPTEISTEWLTILGISFIDDNPKQKIHYEGDILFYMCGFEFTNSMIEGFICYEINEGKTVYKYVHQLQNLYFSLTGKELK